MNQIFDPLPRAVYICPGDPYASPRGGQTAFAVQALNAFGGDFALVAPDELGNAPIGVWFRDAWNGAPIWRFNLGAYAPNVKSRRPLIPRRLVFRRLVAKHLRAISEAPVDNVFCDSPEILGILRRRRWNSFCYRFAGLNNPVAVSRYPMLRCFAKAFHRVMINNLKALRPDALLASADRETIADFERRNPDLISVRKLDFFPTRFDPTIFQPGDPDAARQELGWRDARPRLLIVGRLCWIKGWRLALETVAELKNDYPKISLRFVGDGEDRAALEKAASELGVADAVIIDGFLSPREVQRRLVAADLFLVASYKEGWSCAFAEALGCGKACVSTSVSGASDMIQEGRNGYIVKSRDPREFAQAIRQTLALLETSDDVAATSLRLSKQYSLDLMAKEWRKLWRPLNR